MRSSTQANQADKALVSGVTSTAAADAIAIGSYLADAKGTGNDAGDEAVPQHPQIFIDAPELAPHKNRPWLQAYLHERYDVPLPPLQTEESFKAIHPTSLENETCQISADLLRFHALLCGATGSGKTRLALHLLYEQLCRGGSLLVMDPKEETLWHIAHLAKQAGIAEEDIHVLLPRQQGVGCPSWNPLDYRALGVPAHEAVAEFVRLIEESSPSWGARLADVLKNAARLAAYHNLSLYEMVALLRQADYRDALLKQEPPDHVLASYVDRASYAETHDYFTREFSRWSAARQAEAVDPVLNKVRSLLDIPFLRALLCANQSTLDLSSLWKRPKVVLVHLDFRALGSEGTRLLAGLLSYNLFQTALRVGTGSTVPVTLSLDEMGIQERFVGGAMKDILALARSYNLRLMTACQHLGQLSPELREALLTVAFKAFFRLGPGDAKPAAGFLCDGSRNETNHETTLTPYGAGAGAITKVVLDLPKRGKFDPPEMERCYHRIADPWNHEISVSPLVWEEFARFQLVPENAGQKLAAFRMLLGSVPRVYVTSPTDDTAYELFGYLARLDPACFDFDGPAPVSLTVRFPRPKVTVLARQSGYGYGNGMESDAARERRWEQTLLGLGQREAVVSTPADGARLVKVREVWLPQAAMQRNEGMDTMDWSRFTSPDQGGQSAVEVEAAWRNRRREMERVRDQATEAKGQDSGESENGEAQGVQAVYSGGVSMRQTRTRERSTTKSIASTPTASTRGMKPVRSVATRQSPMNPKRSAISPDEGERTNRRQGTPLPAEPEVADDGSL